MPINYSLDIIVPAKNEAENFPELLRRIDLSLAPSKLNYRVIVVDDHSTDNSLQVLNTLSSLYPLKIVSKTGPSGKAFALIEGAKYSSAPVLAMIDADLEYPPEALPKMFALIDTHGVVVANRVSNHKTIFRRLASKLNRFVFGRLLLGLSCDVQSGLKLFHRDVMDNLDISLVKAWAIDMPLLHTARELGHKVGIVEINFIPRVIGLSKCKAEIGRAIREIAIGAVRVKLSKKRSFIIAPDLDSESKGAGVHHRGKKFITHTRLAHNRSAMITMLPGQKFILVSFVFLLLAGLVVNPLTSAIIFIALLSIVYFADSVFSLFVVVRSLHFPPEQTFAESDIQKLKDSDLPMYSIMCPLYKEREVLPDFLAAMDRMNWPKSKLDVLLLLEEDDPETVAVARAMTLPSYVRIIVVPNSQPKTKPKACNYGLHFIKGEYVVIYDAEDKPDVDQLKKAFLGFKNSRPNTVCLQAKLNYFNPHQNLLTRFFTAEYSLWFDVVLPGLQSINTIIPLGGTSNHFRSKVIKSLHGWDAFNVTEDCDLGCRLFKEGYTTGIIDSVTLEEANSHVGNWIRQRSRWIKGYFQTYLVHNRDWLKFVRTHGIHALIFHLVIGLRITFMLINPILWIATILYFVAYQYVGPTIESLYPSWVFYMAGFSLVFGNFLYLYYYMIGAAKRGHWELMKYVLTVPLYWVLVSIAAVKAFYQLIVKPHFWEKTNHGLHLAKKAPLKRLVKLPGISNFSKISFPIPTRLTTAPWYSGSILVLATGIAFFCNFLYNSYLSQKASISFADFGLISLIGSFNYLFQIPIGALGKTVSYRSAYLFGKHGEAIRVFWAYIRRRAFIVSLGFLVIWLVLTPILSRLFQTDSILPLLLYSPGWIIFALAAVDSGYLSGAHRFRTLGILAITEAVVKLVFTIALVEFGYQHLIFAAVPFSATVAFLFGWYASLKISAIKAVPDQQSIYFPVKYFYTSILTKFSALAFLSLDVLVVKIFLPPAAAGQYALISVIGKMVYFASTLFNQFITPVISRSEGAGENTRHKFLILVSLSTAAGLLGFLGVGIFGGVITPLLFGVKATVIVPFLPAYTLAMVLFSLASSIVDYHQVKKHYQFSLFGLVIGPLLTLGIAIFPKDVSTAVTVVLSLSCMYLAGVLVLHMVSPKLDWLRNNLEDLFDLLTRNSKLPIQNSENLRLLIFNWYDIKHVWAGGAEIYIHKIAADWVKSGHSVTMFTGNDLHNPRHETVDGIKVVRRGGLYTVAFWAALYYLVKFRNRYDVVIDIPKGVPFFTPFYVRKPIVCLVHQIHQEMFRAELKFPFKQLSCFLEGTLMPLVYRHVPIVAVSESTKLAVESIGLGAHSSVSVVVPGVEIVPAPVAKTSFPQVLYLGRLRPYKSVDVLIKAAGRVVQKVPNLKVVIAGSGEDEARLKALVARLHLERVVTFTGRVSEAQKAKLFTQSWLAVQPSTVEGWGITNIEANICGTPVVAANSDGLRDSVIDGVTGMLFKPGSVVQLANIMRHLLVDRQVNKELATNARDWATKFSWPQSSSSLLTIVKHAYVGTKLSKKAISYAN